jgi:hypothetical protein
MLKPLVRSLCSMIAAACFALVATTGGVMPACSGQSVAGHAQHGSPSHPGGHHGMPSGTQACVVHLCCAHLDAPSPATLGGERLVAHRAAPSFLPSALVQVTRSPHALPFAQAPPAPLV